MSINKQSSNGYALSLLVGINDEFTKQSSSIKQEANRLEKEIKDLQKTTGDVTKFKKAQESLEDLEKQQLDNKSAIEKQKDALKKLKKESGDTSEYKRQQKALQQLEKENRDITASTREYERQLRRLRTTLGEAGVDVKNLASDEAKLKAQIEKSNQALKEQNTRIKEVGQSSARSSKMLENLGVVAGVGIAAKNTIFSANDADRNARIFAARTGLTHEQVTAPEQRKFRADLMRDYNVNSGEAFNAQMMAVQQGGSMQEQQQLAEAALSLFKIDPNLNVEDSMRAVKNASRAFDVSPMEAAGFIGSVYQKGGMINSADLLDTFQEYSSLLGDQMSLEQFSAMLVAGNQAGVWNYDKIGDSLKETFRARFSDSSEFAKLVGDGNTAGAIDGIRDAELRQRLYDASNKMRNAYKSGTGQGEAYAQLLQVLSDGTKIDPSNIKPVLEAVGGIVFSEDLGVKGIRQLAEAANSPNDYAQSIDVAEVAKSTLTSLDQAQGQLNSTTGAVNDKFGELLHSTEGIVDAFDGLSQKMTSSIIDSPATAIGGIAAAGLLGVGALKGKIGGKLLGRLLGVGSGGSGGSGLLSRFSGLTGPAANTLGNAGGWVSKMGRGALKGVPFLGAAINTAMIGEDIATGDDRGLWRDIGGILGGIGGGALGLLGGPALALAGGVGGDVAGRQVGEWLYNVFNGKNDDVTATENMVSNATSTAAITGPQNAPVVQVYYQPQIHVDATNASTEDAQAISQSIVDALRNATPELKQEISNVMNDIMVGNDYLKH